MRAYYGIIPDAFKGLETIPDAVVAGRDEDFVYLLSFNDPNEALISVGAERLGSKLHELDLPIIEQLIQYRVQRVVDGETLDLVLPATEIEEGDEVIGDAMPRVIIAGDDPEDYL